MDRERSEALVSARKEPEFETKLKAATCAKNIDDGMKMALQRRLTQYSMGWIDPNRPFRSTALCETVIQLARRLPRTNPGEDHNEHRYQSPTPALAPASRLVSPSAAARWS